MSNTSRGSPLSSSSAFEDGDAFIPHRTPTFKERFVQRTKENPFVIPLVLLTGYQMHRMAQAIASGNQVKFQSSQRWRVGLQAFTVVMVGGTMWYQAAQKAQSESQAHPTLTESIVGSAPNK